MTPTTETTSTAAGDLERLRELLLEHIPLRADETSDFAEIKDIYDEKVALTVRPELILVLNDVPQLIERLSASEQREARAVAERDSARQALEVAAQQFDQYARSHSAKRTLEADAKAVVNTDMARMCRAASAKVTPA